MFKKSLVLMAVAVLVSGCGSTGGPKQTGGALLGGIGGAAIGSQFGKGDGQLVGVAAVTLLGALIGSEVGASLDKADKMYANQTAQSALESNPTGQGGSWSNPDSGHSGAVVPTKTFQTNSGQYCREFTQTVQIGNDIQEAYGTACRQPDGTWKIVQ